MKKIIKRSISVLLCLATCFAFTIVSSAANLGELDCWNSNENRIGRWTSNPTVYRIPLSSGFSTDFISGMARASSEWGSVDGIGFSYASSQSSADIICYGGTVEELSAIGVDEVFDSTVAGRTVYNDITYEGTYTYDDSTKYGYIMNNPTVYVLDKDRTLNQIKKTAVHEMGHALGWFGHSSNTSDVMDQGFHGVISLTERDIQHLKQVY